MLVSATHHHESAMKVKVKSLSHVRLFATPCTVAYQAPLSVEFPRKEHRSGLPFPSPGDLPDPRIEPWSPTLYTDALPSEPPGKSAIGIHMSPPTCPPSHPSRLSQSTGFITQQIPPGYLLDICFKATLSIYPILSFLHSVPKSVL